MGAMGRETCATNLSRDYFRCSLAACADITLLLSHAPGRNETKHSPLPHYTSYVPDQRVSASHVTLDSSFGLSHAPGHNAKRSPLPHYPSYALDQSISASHLTVDFLEMPSDPRLLPDLHSHVADRLPPSWPEPTRSPPGPNLKDPVHLVITTPSTTKAVRTFPVASGRY